MDVDESIDLLGAALVDAGVAPPEPPDSLAIVNEIASAVAPLQLPAELRRLYERIDPLTLNVRPFPMLCEPHFGLDSWRRDKVEFPGMVPASLFLVGYESWNCMSIELDGPSGGGSALFEWRRDGTPFYLRYNYLTDWLAHMAKLVAVGSSERRETEETVWLDLIEQSGVVPLSAPRPEQPPHPTYGENAHFGPDPLGWPIHWQRASGLRPDDIEPRGATHTIAEVLAMDPAQGIRATISAEVVGLMSGGRGVRVRVDDGTGKIDVSCPTEVTMLGPRIRQRFEFDVILPSVERGAAKLPPLPSEARSAHERLTEDLLARFGGPAEALAEAIRPVERSDQS